MPTIRTWMVEHAVVGAFLGLLAVIGGGRFVDYVTALAVLLSFSHAQVADRLQEAEGARAETGGSAVACVPMLNRYWTAKEVLWAVVFLASWNLPALAGCAVLGLYPGWRRVWRRIHPRTLSEQERVALDALIKARLEKGRHGTIRGVFERREG